MHFRVLLSVIVFLNTASTAIATTADTSHTSPMVITATREARKRMDLPESVAAFDQSTIESVSPSHPSEILNRAAGVHVNNLGGEGHRD